MNAIEGLSTACRALHSSDGSSHSFSESLAATAHGRRSDANARKIFDIAVRSSRRKHSFDLGCNPPPFGAGNSDLSGILTSWQRARRSCSTWVRSVDGFYLRLRRGDQRE